MCGLVQGYFDQGADDRVDRLNVGHDSLLGILLLHDDLHLPLGRLRFKAGGGGHGGQNGVRDIMARLGPNFVRLKVGIGQPQRGDDASWVLAKFQEGERELLERVVLGAADALEVLGVASSTMRRIQRLM